MVLVFGSLSPWLSLGCIAAKKSDFVCLLTSLLQHIRGMAGDDRVRFVKFDGGAEFVSEDALQVYSILFIQ